MSQENVEIVRKAIDAWNERDSALWLSYTAPEIEWRPAGPAAVERTVYRGRDEVVGGFESVWETWDEFRFEESKIRDLDESVLWLGQVKMTGAASHVALDQEFAIRFILRGGKVVVVEAFLTWRDALKAVGVEE